jgi:hypothetical protein
MALRYCVLRVIVGTFEALPSIRSYFCLSRDIKTRFIPWALSVVGSVRVSERGKQRVLTVHPEKKIDQLLVRNDIGVKGNLNRLGVARRSCAHLPIGGICRCAAGIADNDLVQLISKVFAIKVLCPYSM